jgi:cysteine synthase B
MHRTLVRPKPYVDDILAQIGNTPLLDLSAFAHAQGVVPAVEIYAKAEWFNPGGSVKARAALQMVLEAEAAGLLRPGKTIIDSSSGNTGIALALIGAARGYDVHLVMPANVSQERKALVNAYGATLSESDPLEGSDGAILHVREIVAADPGRYCYMNQYNNPATDGRCAHALRGGVGHDRHLHGHGALSQGTQSGCRTGGRAAGG